MAMSLLDNDIPMHEAPQSVLVPNHSIRNPEEIPLIDLDFDSPSNVNDAHNGTVQYHGSQQVTNGMADLSIESIPRMPKKMMIQQMEQRRQRVSHNLNAPSPPSSSFVRRFNSSRPPPSRFRSGGLDQQSLETNRHPSASNYEASGVEELARSAFAGPYPSWNMAEVFDRRDRGHGGGGYGGSRGKKRRYDDEDDYERRPHQRQYHHHRPVDPPSRRVTRQILAVAESPMNRPENEVMDLARSIADHYDDEIFRTNILGLFPVIVTEQPLKIPFVAAIAVHLNRDKPEMVKQIIDIIGSTAQEKLNTGDWRSFKLLLRFLACANSVFDQDSLFPLLNELFNRAADLQTSSEDDVLGPEIVRIIMMTIPYILANSLDENNIARSGEILEKTAVIASAPSDNIKIALPYLNPDAESTPTCPNVLPLLQTQLQNEAEKGWHLACIPRLIDEKHANGINGTEDGGEAPMKQTHPFPSITVPETVSAGLKPVFPQVFFSLYADQDIETVPPTSNIAATLIRDTLVDTINNLHFNRNATARIMIDVDCFWAPGTFIKRGTPFDGLKDLSSGESTWKTEDVAVDAIFSQVFQLPAPEHKIVYYHSLITETTQLAPGAIAPSLGRAIRFLYRNLDIMDLEVSYRFMDWFAHHLSNFDYRWKWAEWVDDVLLPNLHPRKAFILGTIDKEIRLAFAKRVRDTLPEPYHVLVPSSRDNEIPQFKYNSETTPYSTEGKEILQLIRSRADDEAFQKVFGRIQTAEAERTNNTVDPMVASTDAYVTAICYIGSKSFSHVLSYIERHKDRLALIGPSSNAARLQIISSAVEYWREVQPGVAVNIVDKLLNYGIITPSSVIEWCLIDPQRLNAGRVLAESWAYEIVAGTITKVTTRVRQILAARINDGKPLPPAHAEQLEQTLETETESMGQLFAAIDDSLSAVATGSNDAMIEDADAPSFKGDADLLRLWGQKWQATFARKRDVELRLIREGRKLFPAPTVEVVMENGGEDAAAAPTTNGDATASTAMEDEVL